MAGQNARNGWTACSETGGRIGPESVDGFVRNRWTDWAGIRTRPRRCRCGCGPSVGSWMDIDPRYRKPGVTFWRHSGLSRDIRKLNYMEAAGIEPAAMLRASGGTTWCRGSIYGAVPDSTVTRTVTQLMECELCRTS